MATFKSSFDAVSGGGGGGGGDLAATLVLGNITGGTDILITLGDALGAPDGINPGDNGADLAITPGQGVVGTAAFGTLTVNVAPHTPGYQIDVARTPYFLPYLTAVNGAPGVNQYDGSSADPLVIAANIAAAINAVPNGYDTLVSAVDNLDGTITVTALVTGTTLNGATLDGNPSGDVTGTGFSGGVDNGTAGAMIADRTGDARGPGAVDLQISRTASNQVAGAPNSVLIGGSNNIIGGDQSYGGAVIVGGRTNIIGVGSTYPDGTYNSTIVGGWYNQILDYSSNAAIIAGDGNRIGGGPNPAYFHTGALVSGSLNVVEGGLPWGGGYYSLTVGRWNVNRGGQNSGIIGRFCEVWNQNSFAGGNVTINKGYSTFMWGQNHRTHDQAHYNSYSDFASAFGAGAYIYNLGQAVWANQNSGAFDTGGTQRSSYGLYIRTTTATPTILTTNGSTTASQRGRLRLMPGRTWAFRIQLVAHQYGGAAGAVADSATWEILGSIKRDLANNTTLVGLSGAGLPLFADAAAAGWSVAVVADDTNEALRITVTGQASKNIVWHAAIYTSEAGFDA